MDQGDETPQPTSATLVKSEGCGSLVTCHIHRRIGPFRRNRAVLQRHRRLPFDPLAGILRIGRPHGLSTTLSQRPTTSRPLQLIRLAESSAELDTDEQEETLTLVTN
jgi:hypothetical protein